MKKIITLMVLLMFLTSNFAVAVADSEKKGNGRDDGTERSDGDSLDDDSDELEIKSRLEIESDDSRKDNAGKDIKNILKIETKALNNVDVIEKLRENYNKCTEKCKGNNGENCEIRCGGLLTSAARMKRLFNEMNQSKIKNIANLSDGDLKKIVHLTRARLKEIAKLSSEQLRAELKSIKLVKVNEKNLEKKRIIAGEKLNKLNSLFDDARKKFMSEEKAYKEKRKEFNEIKEKLKSCKDDDSEECKQLNEEAIARGKEFLMHAADLVIDHLNKIKAKAESSENLGDDEANEIVQKIDTAIKELEDAKAKANDAATKEELQAAAKMIDDAWKRTEYNAMAYAARIVHTKVGEIIARSENLENKLQCAVSSMEEQGFSTDDADELIDKFSEKVSEARNEFDSAKELLKQARDIKANNERNDENEAKIKELLRQAKELIGKAHDGLKEAHEQLKSLFKLIKENGVDINSCRADEDLKEGEVYDIEESSELTTDAAAAE